MIPQQRYLRFDFITLRDGCARMFSGDIIDEIIKIPLRRWKSLHDQFRFRCLVARCASSFLLAAHLPRTCE